MDRDTRHKVERLEQLLRACGSVCVGYSGGVDSVYLATSALDTLGAAHVLAVTGRSASYPAAQHAVAVACARQFGIPHLVIDTNELDDERYTANPTNRCYFCKAELWPRLIAVARARGLDAVLDGSNADDAHDYRPGFAAAREHNVRAPLLEAGLTKAEIRALSQARGLPTWDMPAAPCLSSRLPYGVAVTRARLREVELAEETMRQFGFREFRVRHHDDCARLELAPAELPRALQLAAQIQQRLVALGLPRVVIDAEGYRRGALNEALVQLAAEGCRRGGVNQPVVASAGARAPAPSELPAHDVAGFHHDIAVLRTAELDTARALAPRLRAAGFRYIAIDASAASG